MILCKKVYNMTVILASASPRRSELLRNLGLSFVICPADLDEESIQENTPSRLVEAISSAKASKVAAESDPNALVIAADTVVVLDGVVLGKPANADAAKQMLSALSGKTHEVYTGVTLRQGVRDVCFHERSEVQFRTLSEEEIGAYLQTGEPMDKAGSYGIQGVGALLVSEIRGDYFNVMGLPLCRLGLALQDFGLNLLTLAAETTRG